MQQTTNTERSSEAGVTRRGAGKRPQPLPESHLDLFQKRSLGYLATLMPNGTPQVTPLWVDYDGEYVLVNSAVGRQKDRNMRARSAVAICIADPDDPARYLAVRGAVVEVTEEGALEHAQRLTERYTGRPRGPHPPGAPARVLYKIRPDRVTARGR